MKRYKLVILEPAHQDLITIKDYIANDLFSPMAAVNMLRTFRSAIRSLLTMPKKHPIIEDAYLYDRQYHKLPVKNYIIFYTVDDNPKPPIVYIERILYARRDWTNILQLPPKG